MAVKKVLPIIIALVLIITGCSDAKPAANPEPAQAPNEPANGSGTAKPNMGITVNTITFKNIESNTRLYERGFVAEQIKDGYNITICSGEKPSGGYDITVKFVEDNEGKTNIVVEEIGPKAGQPAASVITYPSTAISIGNNISPSFHVSNTKGDIFKQLRIGGSANQRPAAVENQFEVANSEKVTGWKKINAKVALQGLTEGGSVPLENTKIFSYSIHFPGTWTFDGSSVFYDGDNKKIAEFPPAVVLESTQESVFLAYAPAVDFGEELKSSSEFNVNGYKGSKTVTSMGTESGIWFPHIYRLSNGTSGFSINIYSKEINDKDQKLFDDIVNTFHIEQ